MHLSERLNAGLLPTGYYALAKQPADEAWPDVLTLEAIGEDSGWTSSSPADTSAARRSSS